VAVALAGTYAGHLHLPPALHHSVFAGSFMAINSHVNYFWH